MRNDQITETDSQNFFNLSQMLNKDKSRAQKRLNYKYKSNRMSMSVCVCRRILATTKPIWFFLKVKVLIIEVLGVFMITLVIILPPKKSVKKFKTKIEI